ncbi:alpha/beta hydrolase family protein [Peptoniphilus catoniae]|uniref:alpha/beta hydrolase family protein n=1 Tax=Peptoniphilus catoniae TaxID=1660341 RepID=UPI0010FEE344|nr:prolyl oligopeptidase family serine peptidase [Peptoniphilus catoniae]
MDYLMSEYATIKDVKVGENPLYVVTPRDKKENQKAIIFYHGWASNAFNQILRANIFAAYGYQVILPEGLYHGRRGRLDYDSNEVLKEYMPRVIMKHIEEFPMIHDYVVNELGIAEENIGVGGHSMGAFTAGGLFTFKKSLAVGLLYNGIMDWSWLVDELSEGDDEIPYERQRAFEFLLQMSPSKHKEDIVDRPIILCNGDEDHLVDPDSMKDFYNDIVKDYKNKDLIRYKRYEATSHQMTTFMIFDSLMFMRNELGFK